MKIVDLIVVVFLVIMLIICIFIFIVLFQGREVKQASTVNQDYYEEGLPFQSLQFFNNMRFPDEKISYWIEEACSDIKREQIIESFDYLDERTNLEFYYSGSPEIEVYCSEDAPEIKVENGKEYFVAGEGGPTKVLNLTNKAVIIEGKISLFRDEECDEPKLALHEILHVLGFDHSSNPESVMYPVTSCKLELDQSIIDEINYLYSFPSYSDLLMERVDVHKTGRYMSFNVSITNSGYKPASDVRFELIQDNEKIYEYSLGEIGIGTKKIFTVQNLKVGTKVSPYVFKVITSDPEIEYQNNNLQVSLVE